MNHFFEGWYYKHQNRTETIAFIPGFADGGAFIQVITDENSYNIEYKLSECKIGNEVVIGSSAFSPRGISLDINQGGNVISGRIAYADLTPITSDIMGPFRLFPMQCRHGVISLHHGLSGSIDINGRLIDLSSGTGYIEKDSGRSFPKSYAWVHSNDFIEKCSVMAAVADIPFMGFHFKGIICAVWHEGIEYRLATYNGAKMVACTDKNLVICQHKYSLEVTVEDSRSHPLAAPQTGVMSRVIKENPSCRAHFRFCEGNSVIFDMESEKTSFEFAK